MERKIIRPSLMLLLILICAAPTMNFSIMVPAAVDFPDHIKSVAMVDRTRTGNKVRDAIESGLTGEFLGEDKLATQIMMDGIHSIMVNSATLDFIRTPEVLTGGSGISAAFPEALDWELVSDLCSKYKVDAIMAIEIFDSDFIILPRIGQAVTVKAGIRIYDPETKSILDQYLFSHEMGVGGRMNSIEDVVGSVLNKTAAIKEVSYDAGVIYGRRISPSWIRISRTYYRRSKGDDNLAEGARLMEVNDWDAAISALTKAVETGRKRKTRGRAAHNLAVVYEITGDLQEAKTWAQTAWAKFKNKDSREYLYDLNQRISENQVLEEQLD